MRPSRRGFLGGLLATTGAPALGWAAAGAPAALAAAKEGEGAYALFGITADGGMAFRIPLPARGHAGAGHPVRAEAVAMARRPGRFGIVLDCVTGREIRRLVPPEGRSFNGHAVYVEDGAVLVTVEQVEETSEGHLGLWDVAAGYERMSSVPTGGIGPHELRAVPGGFAVANGGIATDPLGREKLNLDTMRPTLALLTPAGALIERQALPEELRQASIRHLAPIPGGGVAAALQWEGAPGVPVPLLALFRPGEAPRLAEAPETEWLLMQGYAGSAAAAGGEIAISSPRGGRVMRFDTDGAFLGAVARDDVCGLAPLGAGFLASDGYGGLIAIRDGVPAALGHAGVAWDNHLVPL